MRPLALLVVCIGLIAGCGGSRYISLADQRAAIAAARGYPGGTSEHTSMFPTSTGTIDCHIPARMSGWYYVGRCTSKVWPHGSGTDVSFIESATALVGPTGATQEAATGHETFLVDRRDHAHFVEISNFFPQNGP